ncbi:MAG: hypothetical protein ACE148_16095 [Vicinamibacterales bacterium]
MRPTSTSGAAEAAQPAGVAARWYEHVPAWQFIYSLLDWNPHFQSVSKELARLEQFLEANGVAVSSAIDVDCGDGQSPSGCGRCSGCSAFRAWT